MLYHMGARNFECKECGNKFFQMEHLKRHMQSIHNTVVEAKSSTNTSCHFNRAETTVIKKSTLTRKTLVAAVQAKQEYSQHEIIQPDKFEFDEINNDNKDVDTQNSSTIANSPPEKKLAATAQEQSLPVDNPDTNCGAQDDSLGPKSFNIISKSTYKCSHCDHSTARLFNLNQHNIREHFASKSGGGDFGKDLCDQDDQTESDDDMSGEFGLSFGNAHNLNEISNGLDSLSYLCSFCSNFRTNTKALLKVILYKTNSSSLLTMLAFYLTFLKRHLKNSHSSQVIPPIILNNDPVLTDPSTKFKCDTCQSFLTNLNEFVRHMNDVHKTQVNIF
jgi:hypothetical protein